VATSELSRAVEVVGGRQRASVALLIVGLLIGSGAVALLTPVDESFAFVSRLGYTCFIAAVIAAFAFIVILQRKIARGGDDDDER
jgi:hypothetical protein